MKVDAPRPVRPGGAVDKAKRNDGGSGFAEILPGAAPETAALSGPAEMAGVAGLETLLALQEVPDAAAQRAKALRRGSHMLERLEELRVGLLLGRIGRDKLGELARLTREGSAAVSDPRLREILQEIELRAEVELAKLSP